MSYNYEDHEDHKDDDSYLDDDCFCSGCCGSCGVYHGDEDNDSSDTRDRDVVAMNNKEYDAAVDAALDAYGKAEEVEIKYLTGFNRAIVGITTDNRVVYGYGDMIAQMMEDDPECTVEDAIEWIDYNTVRSLGYMGEGAPIILSQGIGEILEMFGPQGDGDGDKDREVKTDA